MSVKYQAELPMLRRACKESLIEDPRIVHYKQLVESAYARLGITPTPEEFVKRTEDLREKVFDVGADGFAYTGKPHCGVVLRRWFARNALFNQDARPVRLLITSELSVSAATEAALRFRWIVDKQNDGDEVRVRRIAKGLLTQTVVSDWVATRWPTLYREPKNHRQWNKWCNHDFALSLYYRNWEVDVAGDRGDGRYGVASEGKPKTDLHLIAELHSLCVEVKGYKRGSEFNKVFHGQETESIERFILMLNCEVAGLDFRQIEKQFREKGIAA